MQPSQSPQPSLQRTQAVFNAAMQAKAARNYHEAFNHIQEMLAENPLALCSTDVWSGLFNAPPWFDLDDEETAYHEYTLNVMESLLSTCQGLDSKSTIDLAQSFIYGAQFRITTHNQANLNRLMSLRMGFFQYAISKLGIDPEHTFSARTDANKKMRVGLIFKHLQNDPELTSLLPYFVNLDRTQFEPIMILCSNSADQHCADLINQHVDQVVQLPDDITAAVTSIRALDLDLALFGNDITAKPSLSAHLSCFRIARKTACAVSTLVTTCSPYVDYYFGCQYYADQGYASEFNEEFVSFNNPGFAFKFPENDKETPKIPLRESLGIGKDTFIFTSGANHTKLHTPLLKTWAEILKKVPNAILTLYPFPPHFGPAREEIIARVKSTFKQQGVDPNRVVVLLPLPGRDVVVEVLKQMDLGLDSFPYTGVTTIVDAVEAGLPTITYAGKQLRTAQGSAILDAVNANNLITHSIDEYINKAVYFASAPDQLSEARNHITQSVKPFFDAEGFAETAAKNYLRIFIEIKQQAHKD